MNLGIIKENISHNIGKRVVVTVRCMRNKKEIYEGTIFKMYPNIFSILTKNGEKTISYADIATKDVLLKYQ